jgi:hypothetical protein
LKKSQARTASPRSTNLANIRISSRFFSIGYGSLAAAHHKSISFSRKNRLLTKASRSLVFSLDFFHSLADWDAGEIVATTQGQIPPLHCGTSSCPLRSLSSWKEMPSSSKCRGSSLASARGLCRWQTVAAHLKFLSRAATVLAGRGSKAYRTDIFERLPLRRMKNPKGLGAYL